MTNKQKSELKQKISYHDVMTKKLGRNIRLFGSFFLLSFAFAVWGFTGMNDAFLHVSDGTRDIIKWIALVIAIISGILTIMFTISFRNSKKFTLDLIDELKDNKK